MRRKGSGGGGGGGDDGDGLRFVIGIFTCTPLFPPLPPTNTFYLAWYLTGYLTRAHVIRRSTGWKVVGFFNRWYILMTCTISFLSIAVDMKEICRYDLYMIGLASTTPSIPFLCLNILLLFPVQFFRTLSFYEWFVSSGLSVAARRFLLLQTT